MIEYYKNLDPRDLFYINDDGLVCCEEWLDVVDYEGIYKISNLGRRKNRCGKIQRPRVKKGYNTARLSKNGKYTEFGTHRLVAIAFIPNPENKSDVNHCGLSPNGKEGNKLDNRVVSLKWATTQENITHAKENGLLAPTRKGTDCNFSKLTEKDVLEIRKSYAENNCSQSVLAKKYSVRQSCIHKIVNNLRWKHLL